ncbi:MAG: hypothetical protein QOJ07_2131, partial [Thermoleophilaceae bacterium]|nr:hypothetical protein [Thermoleophilaceae bacterium]
MAETLTPVPAPAGDLARTEPITLETWAVARAGTDRDELAWRLAPVALAALCVLLYALLDPHPVDLAAGTYRAELFGREGFAVWNGQWYGGHHLPAYSMLFPPLAWLLGPVVLGAGAALAAAAGFESLARGHFGRAARVGAAWFGLGMGALLFTGRMPFALGMALGLAALLALQRHRVPLAVVLSALTSLASPVAGLFIAIGAGAHAVGGRSRASALAAGAALAPPIVLSLAFPDSGRQVFLPSELRWHLFAAAAVFAFLPRRERTLRIATVLYAAAGVVAYLATTPLGNNVTRLGALAAGPLIACALVKDPRRFHAPLRVGLAAVCVAMLAYYQLSPAVRDASKVEGDPSAQRSYYDPLLGFLERAGGPPARVEIPFTRSHWETATIAPRFPLARGWERQIEAERSKLFYGGLLNAQTYGRWLDQNGVRWVAVPDAKLDFSAWRERALIDRGLPYLKLRWRSAHWRVYENTGRHSLAV